MCRRAHGPPPSANASLSGCLLFLSTAVYANAQGPPQSNSPVRAAPLLHTVRIPCDVEGARPGGYPPHIFLAKGLLAYENGRYGSPVVVFDAATFEKRWTFLTGRNDRPYFGAADGSTFFFRFLVFSSATSELLAVERTTVKTLWTGRGADSRTHYGTPQFVVGDALVTIGWTYVSAFDKTSGKNLWLVDFDLPGNRIARHVTARKRLAEQARPIFWGIGGKVYAMDPATGEILWHMVIEKAEKLFGTGLLSDGDTGLGNKVVQPCKGIVLFYHYMRKRDNTLFAVDVETRTVLWKLEAGSINSFELDAGDALIAKSRELRCSDARTGKEKWRYATSKTRTGPFTISDGVIYCCESWLTNAPVTAMARLHAIRRSDGAPLWRYTVKGWFRSPPLVHGGKLYVVSPETGDAGHDGVIRVFDHEKTARLVAADTDVAQAAPSR